MKRLSILLLLVPLLSACMGDKISESMKSWVGHPESELVQSWGPPTSVYKMDDGSKVLTYSYRRSGYQTEGEAYTDQYGVTHYTAPQVTGGYTATRNFTINSNGFVTSWRWNGY